VSLLDKAETTLTVYPSVETVDDWGNVVRVPGDVPIEVGGSLQPSSSEEFPALGQVALTAYRFICRRWPGDPWAAVYDEDGNQLEPIGDPRRYRQSRAVSHDTVYLKTRG